MSGIHPDLHRLYPATGGTIQAINTWRAQHPEDEDLGKALVYVILLHTSSRQENMSRKSMRCLVSNYLQQVGDALMADWDAAHPEERR